ncbi:hypothetical protein Caka_0193 [Coraliomargarita akajimensis DSM 45221]|uniref:Uncharacterized protein n=1 Tax=Coraliomargarita akajimensis (strain DSM 45221 / IAM 15411 / JCM 23193 / KCTC 12865 / 04OKA010-24) TaxID=583355 RepID=D5ELP5_CORAD|nr:hypothetical protein Caka_0193 [Coraliomargarita akajimensis DSM 45221]
MNSTLPTKSQRKRSSRSSRTRSDSSRFLPNYSQFEEALKQLPDADEHDGDTYECRVLADEQYRSIKFAKTKIQRGSKYVSRWVYDGKILIRNRDL